MTGDPTPLEKIRARLAFAVGENAVFDGWTAKAVDTAAGQLAVSGGRLVALTTPPLQLICTLRKTRSWCGISAVKRPSAVVTAVSPSALPFGLAG